MEFIVSSDREKLRELEETLHMEAQQPRSGVEIRDLGGLPDAVFIGAQIDGEIVGATTLDNFGAGSCELHKLYVDPRYRKQGIGAALVQRSMSEARARGASEFCIKVTGKSSGFWRRCLQERSGEVVESVGYLVDLNE